MATMQSPCHAFRAHFTTLLSVCCPECAHKLLCHRFSHSIYVAQSFNLTCEVVNWFAAEVMQTAQLALSGPPPPDTVLNIKHCWKVTTSLLGVTDCVSLMGTFVCLYWGHVGPMGIAPA
jgi:hypothetical protein